MIEPRLANLDFAKGTVATEFGPVRVEWSRLGETLAFSIQGPEGIEICLRFANADANTMKIDGQTPIARSEGRYAVVMLHSSKCRGTVVVLP